MNRKVDPERLVAQLASASGLAPCTVVTGDEILLAIEAVDALRQAARRLGYTERTHLILDARSDWSAVFGALQNTSLFGDRKLLELSLPTGKPGKAGGEALQRLAAQLGEAAMADTRLIVRLPALDRQASQSKWAQALRQASEWVEIAPVSRAGLPAWIRGRLARQEQQMDEQTLAWVADKVEGNLLAAHHEILKLGLLYPPGPISRQAAETAVLDVARYNLFDLRDAMLQGQAQRALAVLEGLRGEGQALLLVLWAVGEEIRILARVAGSIQAGARPDDALRAHRLFGPRERQARQALARVPPGGWAPALRHVHEIDCLIKGIPVAGRLADPWDEIARLVLRIALAGRPSS